MFGSQEWFIIEALGYIPVPIRRQGLDVHGTVKDITYQKSSRNYLN